MESSVRNKILEIINNINTNMTNLSRSLSCHVASLEELLFEIKNSIILDIEDLRLILLGNPE